MTTTQALIAYLTMAALTLCFLGSTKRLPGQSRFRADSAATAAELHEAAQDAGKYSVLADHLKTANTDGLLHVLYAAALWPLYWAFTVALSAIATVRVNRS